MDALSNLSKDTGPLASTISEQLLAAQKANKDGVDPHLAQVGKTSMMDKLVGGAATGAGFLRLFGGLKKPTKPPIMY